MIRLVSTRNEADQDFGGGESGGVAIDWKGSRKAMVSHWHSTNCAKRQVGSIKVKTPSPIDPAP